MKNYVKPVVLLNEEISEGVYAASGEACYTVSAYIHQRPETGRGDYRLQVNGSHAAGDGHHSGEQILVLTFNQPVEYSGSNGEFAGYSDGNNTISIVYNYHNNGNDNVGLGDVIVVSDEGLGEPSATLYCNYDCGQHTPGM